MARPTSTENRIAARDAAMRLLNRLTTCVAVVAFAGVGLLGTLSAHTIPGTASSQATSTSTSSGSSSSTSSSSTSTSSSSSSSLQSSSSSVTSSSGSAVAVSGGSH